MATPEEIEDYLKIFEEFRPAPQEIINLEDIGNGLTADFVIQTLTFSNPFYYQYTPREGDCLYLKEAGGRHPLAVIYLQKEWTFLNFQEMRLGKETLVDEGFVEFIYQPGSSSVSE